MERIVSETLIVDVSQTDWSEHPAWQRDFEAKRLECKPDKFRDLEDCIQPRELVAIRRVYIADGKAKVEKEDVESHSELIGLLEIDYKST